MVRRRVRVILVFLVLSCFVFLDLAFQPHFPFQKVFKMNSDPPTPMAAPTFSFSLLSLNMAMPLLTSTDLVFTKKARADALIQKLKAIKEPFDIVCLQELFTVPSLPFASYASYLETRLREIGYPYVVTSPSSGYAFKQNSGLLIASRFQLLHAHHLYFDTQDEGTTQKGALRAVVAVPWIFSNDSSSLASYSLPLETSLTIITTHLSSSSNDAVRQEQLQQLDQSITSQLGTSLFSRNSTYPFSPQAPPVENGPLILAGDLNQQDFNGLNWPTASPLQWKTAYNKPLSELKSTFPEENVVLDHIYYTPQNFGDIHFAPVLQSSDNSTVQVHAWDYLSSCHKGECDFKPISDHNAISAILRFQKGHNEV